MVHFLNAFWHGKETFPKSSSQNEITPLLIVIHLPYSKCKGLKMCFYLCRYKIKIFHSCRTSVVLVALVSHSCRQCSNRVAVVSHSCRSCLTRVALVLHSCRSCHTRVARVWYSCCKLDYFMLFYSLFYWRHQIESRKIFQWNSNKYCFQKQPFTFILQNTCS